MRDGWVNYKFKDVATAIKGKLPKSKNEDGIGVPYLTASYLRSSQPDYWIENLEGAVTAEDGDCLILWDGAGAGDLFSARRGVVSSTMAVVTTQNSKIMREFLTLFISSKADYIKETCRGTTVPHVSPDAIANMELKIPPLPEQKRIVDLISSVDSYIEALQQQLESAKRSRNAVLHELLTAGGDDWEESTLGRLLTLEYGKPLTDENRDGIGFPVFASAGVVGMHSEPLVSNSPVIVVGRKGTAGAVHWSSTPCFVIDTAYFVKPISDIDLRFLYLLLGFIDLKSVTAQTGVPGLNRDRAYSLKCNVPPKSKQLEVVSIVTQLDDFIDSTQGTINRSQDLRSGLLSDLLSGEHEIPASYDKVMSAA
jgi:restriction endonuclease S subunit